MYHKGENYVWKKMIRNENTYQDKNNMSKIDEIKKQQEQKKRRLQSYE